MNSDHSVDAMPERIGRECNAEEREFGQMCALRKMKAYIDLYDRRGWFWLMKIGITGGSM